MAKVHSSRRSGAWLLGAISALTAAGCAGHEASVSSQSDAVQASLGRSCSATGGRILAPIGARRDGSSVAMATLAGHPVALLADEDDHAVQIVDLERNTLVSRTEVGGAPSQLLVLSDGRVLVTVQDQNRIA